MITTPRILLILIVLLLCSAVVIGAHSPIQAANNVPDLPPIPDSVYGMVRVNNLFVPAGTLVSAWCSGTKVTETSAVDNNGETWYSLGIPGDDPATPAKDGCSTGEIVSFKIWSDTADQQKTWISGSDPTQLDLSLTNLIPIYIPLVRK